MRWVSALFVLLATEAVFAQMTKQKELTTDHRVLHKLGLPTDGPGLLKILRDRTPSAELIDQAKKQLAGLQSDKYSDRRDATTALIKLGPIMRPFLERMLYETTLDAEMRARLREVINNHPPGKDTTALAV